MNEEFYMVDNYDLANLFVQEEPNSSTMSEQENNQNQEAADTAERIIGRIASAVPKVDYSQTKSLTDATVDKLLPNVSAFRKRGDFCDVSLKVGDTVFKCHRLILAANSPYFASLFKNDFNESEEEVESLPSEYVDETSFSKLLNVMYREPFSIEDDLVPLYTTSVYLQLTYCIDRLQTYIVKNLEVIDTVELLLLPELHMNKELYTLVKKHVCRNFSKLYSRMAAISLDIFEDLFKDPELFITSRDQVVDFGNRWISHNIRERKYCLQKVAASLKPFHTPSEQSLELVNNLAKHLQNNYDVKVALNTLLELSDAQNECKLEISKPLFFVQPNSESEILFGTYKDGIWTFLNEFRLPVATDLLEEYEAAAANDTIYVSAKRKTYSDSGIQRDVIFHGLVGKTHEWVELISPRSMPICLTVCNSTIYSYEHSQDDHQISVFEPFLNRWLKVPAVNYPRTYAGIASHGHVLYMVGGIPQKQIGGQTPTNIVEMYDSRCGNWSRISVSGSQTISNHEYNKRVCFHNNILYMVERNETKLRGIDIRKNAWISVENPFKNAGGPIKEEDGFLITVDKELWFIHEYAEHGILVMGHEKIPNPNVFVKPIPSAE